MATPTYVRRGNLTPDARAMTTAQTGWVATSAVAVATEVRRRDGSHAAKCNARNTPDTNSNRASRGEVSARKPRANGAVAIAASEQRQNATAIAGAAIAAVNGPEVAAASTATVSNVPSITSGRCSDGDDVDTPTYNRTRGLPPRAGLWHARGVSDTPVEPAATVTGRTSAGPGYPEALVHEAMKGSALSWITVPGSRARAAWHVWHDGSAYVVHARDDRLAEAHEQPVPGLGDASTVAVTARGADWGRVVTWSATVTHPAPGSPEWEAALALLRGVRLNEPDPAGVPARWAHSCQIAVLHPTDELLEAPGGFDESSLAAAAPPSPATTMPTLM